MPATDVTDEQLLTARDAASFERFYVRHVDAVLAYFSRRTRDAELSADLCAETFAAALASRHRFRPGQAPATAWLFGIGSKKLADAQRRGYAEMRARRRLGMERIELSDQDLARIDRLGEGDEALVWMERLAPEQRDGGPRARDRRAPLRRDRGRAGHVGGSGAQAGQPRAGGDANADGSASMNQDFVTQLQLQLREAALREERRTPAAQRFVRARRGLPGPAPLAAALAIALLALAVAIGALQLRGEPKPVKPRVIHTFTVGNEPVVARVRLRRRLGRRLDHGRGAADRSRRRAGRRPHPVRRRGPGHDRRGRRVGAQRRPADGRRRRPACELVAHRSAHQPRRRADPDARRRRATTSLRSPSKPTASTCGCCGAAGALRIDPERNAADRFVSFQGEPVDSVARGERVWALLPGRPAPRDRRPHRPGRRRGAAPRHGRRRTSPRVAPAR